MIDVHRSRLDEGYAYLVVIIANADATLVGESVSPPTADFDVGLGDAAVAQEEPQTENRLGQYIEHSVGDDLAVNRSLAGTVGEAPDAGRRC